jgi:branched-subunit amino acid transport protein
VTTSYGPAAIWGVVVAIGVVTFLIRVSFVALFGRLDTVPPRVQQALRFVPAAVLSALVAPSLVTIEPTVVATLTNERLLAGVVAAVVAWRTENVFATIVVGMLALWTLRFAV